MSCEKVVAEFPRGSDVGIEIPFTDDDDEPIPMTGYSIEIFEAGPRGPVEEYVTANATVEWEDQAQGIAVLRLPWSSDNPAEFWVRLRIVPSPASFGADGIDPLWVRYT